ncbi:MAG: type II toxin-antitoxin system RelE/ParE family toxin [Bacteriovoracaceae bacterium]
MLKWTPKSQDDLEKMMEYIAENFNINLAIDTVNDLIDYTENLLSSNPLAGSILESNPLFSKLIYKGNSIYYCENPKDKNLYVVYVQLRTTDFDRKRVNSDEVA